MPLQVQYAMCVGKDQLAQHDAVRSVPHRRAVWSWTQCWGCLPCRIHTPHAGFAGNYTGLSPLDCLHGKNTSYSNHTYTTYSWTIYTPHLTWLRKQCVNTCCLCFQVWPLPAWWGWQKESTFFMAAHSGWALHFDPDNYQHRIPTT